MPGLLVMASRTRTASGLMTSNRSGTSDWPEGDLMPDPADGAAAKPARPRGVAGTIWALEHAQDFVTVAVGVVLIALAAVLVVAGLISFIRTVGRSAHLIPVAAIALLDQVLLVLILVEIVHTVVLSLRAHRLAAQPFIIVGLVAVIRRILFVLSSEVKVNTAELGLLIAMLVAFVASFIAVSWFEKRVDQDMPPRATG
jgi:uncharacterized membrane protein (DUF373 family)